MGHILANKPDLFVNKAPLTNRLTCCPITPICWPNKPISWPTEIFGQWVGTDPKRHVLNCFPIKFAANMRIESMRFWQCEVFWLSVNTTISWTNCWCSVTLHCQHWSWTLKGTSFCCFPWFPSIKLIQWNWCTRKMRLQNCSGFTGLTYGLLTHIKTIWRKANRAVKEFVSAIKEWAGRKIKNSKDLKSNFLNIMATFRHLTFASCSLQVSRLDQTCTKIGLDTLVHTIDQFCALNLTAHKVIPLVLQRGDPPIHMGFKKLCFMVYGFPKLCFMLKEIHKYFLPWGTTDKPRKLLITEDILISALFIELTYKLVYVHVKNLYAGLQDTKRVELVKQFNNPEGSLLVLVIMYQVSAQGMNLDMCCCRVIVRTSAGNSSSEVQA